MTEIAKADQILSDPDFDVESFVKFVNIFYENPTIVNRLSSSIDIFISLIKTKEYRFLISRPDLIDKDIFQKLHETGYEVWHKSAQVGWRAGVWWGVIIENDLAIHYRFFQRRPDFKVINESSEKIRKRWARKNMCRYGEKTSEKNLGVYNVRKRVNSFIENNLISARRIRFNPRCSKIQRNFWHQGSNKLRFDILQSGEKHVRVRVFSRNEHDIFVKDKKVNKYGEWRASIRLPIDDSNLELKIVDWACRANVQNKEFSEYDPQYMTNMPKIKKPILDVLNDLKIQAGI